MLNKDNTETDILAFELSDYENFVENDRCEYTDCNECDYYTEYC